MPNLAFGPLVQSFYLNEAIDPESLRAFFKILDKCFE